MISSESLWRIIIYKKISSCTIFRGGIMCMVRGDLSLINLDLP